MASITWEPNVSSIVYGELIGESIFSARAIYQDADGDDYSPDGTYVYTYSGAGSGTLTAGKKLDAGNYTLTATFDPAEASLGSNITGTASLTVEKATPAVVWNNPPDITYALFEDDDPTEPPGSFTGPKLSDHQLNAIADIAGDFTYSPPLETELNATEPSPWDDEENPQKVTATFVPSDTDNYKSLPLPEKKDQSGNIIQKEVKLEIEFHVLKGEIQIVWPILENGLCQEIRKKKSEPKIIPYDLKYKAEDGTGKGLPRPKFLSIYKQKPRKEEAEAYEDGTIVSFEAEIPGSIVFNPPEDSELCDREDLIPERDAGGTYAPADEGKFITVEFEPDDPSNWKGLVNSDGKSGKEDSVLLIAKHQFTIYKRISGPDIAPTMFGCYVQSVSASVGWGGSSSTCSLRLVEDPDKNAPNEKGFVWTPPGVELENGDFLVGVGAACYFQYKGFYFGGVFTRWSYGESTSGRYYDIVLESPAKFLDGVQVIMDSFEGTEYNFGEIPENRIDKIPKDNPNTNENYEETGRYNRFRPSSQNPNITTEVNNVYNALGHFENFSFGGIFGGADINSVGFPANKLLETIELLSCPDEKPDDPDSPGVDPDTGKFKFAHKCALGELPHPDFDPLLPIDPITNPEKIPQEYYKIDLSQINDIAPDYYRISGVAQSINGIISDVTELMQHDYFVTVEKDINEGELEAPAIIADEEGKALSTVGLSEEELLDYWEEGDDGGGLIINPNIKVVAISKGAQPAPGVIKSLVNDFKSREDPDGKLQNVLISSSIGQELQDDTTQKLIIGGPASRLVTRRTAATAWPIWAKRGDSSYRFDFPNPLLTSDSYAISNSYSSSSRRIPIFLDPYAGTTYKASIFELRMATAGRNTWQTYKVFESVKNGTYENDPWCVDIDVDEATLRVLAAGNRGAMSLASTKGVTAGKAFNTDFRENYSNSAEQYTDRLFECVKNTANNFYGKMFALEMPEEPGGIDNNIRWIIEDQKYETSWEAVDSAFDPGGTNFRFNDVAMFDPNGRTKTYAEWTYTNLRDFSVLSGNYAKYTGNMWTQNEDMEDNIGQGVASTSCSIEKSSYFFSEMYEDKQLRPFVVMNTGNQIVEYDSMTTPDFGLTVLAKYFFGINIPPENYIGPGKANTKITIPPKVVPPFSFGIAQQSNRYVWGPWYGGNLKGKTEVIQDESLVPESFGSVGLMNQAGEALANVGNAEMIGSETGYVEIAEFPSYNIAERFAGSGPYVSDMSFNIDISGFKTTYKFNTWTPQFGKLAKYNIDRIARINKASLELAQRERAKMTKRSLLPPPSPMTAEDLVNRLNRQDISLSLGQIFPPGGGLNGTWEVADVSVSDLGPLAEGGGVYNRVAGTSKDAALITVHIAKDLSENSDMPSFEAPEVVGESGEDDGIQPNSKSQSPFFSPKINNDDGTEAFEKNTTNAGISDPVPDDLGTFAIDNMPIDKKRAVTAIRTMATSLPRPAAGWGFDVAYNPVPNDGNDLLSFDGEFQKNPALRKAGPISFLWDEERKHWAGGLEFLGGTVEGAIEPATSPTDPTTFTLKVFRKATNQDARGTDSLSHEGETITCYNRDTHLHSEGGDNIWAIVIRLNYEWTPIWVSCI